jgi:DNA repair protein RadC
MASDFKKLSDKVKPREQLRDAVSPSELKPEALLAILLRTGSAGCNVLETARRLVDAFGSVAELVKSDWRTLDRHIRKYNELHPERRIKGVGQLKMLELAAAFELVRRGYEIDGEDIRRIKIAKPEDSYRIFREAALMGEEQESFFVLPLDTKNHPLCTAPLRVTYGLLDQTPVHPREVFKAAIRWGAQSIIVAHNHPSGDTAPSKADLDATAKLREAGDLLNVPLIDHIILGHTAAKDGGPPAFTSLAESLPNFNS